MITGTENKVGIIQDLPCKLGPEVSLRLGTVVELIIVPFLHKSRKLQYERCFNIPSFFANNSDYCLCNTSPNTSQCIK